MSFSDDWWKWLLGGAAVIGTAGLAAPALLPAIGLGAGAAGAGAAGAGAAEGILGAASLGGATTPLWAGGTGAGLGAALYPAATAAAAPALAMPASQGMLGSIGTMLAKPEVYGMLGQIGSALSGPGTTGQRLGDVAAQQGYLAQGAQALSSGTATPIQQPEKKQQSALASTQISPFELGFLRQMMASMNQPISQYGAMR